jgi:hypothetical protein
LTPPLTTINSAAFSGPMNFSFINSRFLIVLSVIPPSEVFDYIFLPAGCFPFLPFTSGGLSASGTYEVSLPLDNVGII